MNNEELLSTMFDEAEDFLLSKREEVDEMTQLASLVFVQSMMRWASRAIASAQENGLPVRKTGTRFIVFYPNLVRLNVTVDDLPSLKEPKFVSFLENTLKIGMTDPKVTESDYVSDNASIASRDYSIRWTDETDGRTVTFCIDICTWLASAEKRNCRFEEDGDPQVVLIRKRKIVCDDVAA